MGLQVWGSNATESHASVSFSHIHQISKNRSTLLIARNSTISTNMDMNCARLSRSHYFQRLRYATTFNKDLMNKTLLYNMKSILRFKIISTLSTFYLDLKCYCNKIHKCIQHLLPKTVGIYCKLSNYLRALYI